MNGKAGKCHYKNTVKRVHDIRRIIANFIIILMLPNLAFAGTKVAEIIGYLCDWLSGEIAAAIAVLVVIYSGYEMLEGRLEKRTLAGRCIALGLIIGGAYIARNIFNIDGY